MPKVIKASISSGKLTGKSSVASLQMTLPERPVEGIAKFELGKYLLVAPPGWGKTEFLLSGTDIIVLATEEGHKFVKGVKMVIDSWDGTEPWLEPQPHGPALQHCSFVDAVELLVQQKGKYSMVGIDTFDSLVKMLLDFTLGKKKAEHASELGDYGKGFDIAQNTPFRKQLNRLLKSGRGVIGTTHEEIVDKNLARGPVSKKETTLPKGIYKQIYGQFDIILHGVFGRIPKGQKTRDRMIITEGSEHLLAKNRGGYFPPGFIVPRDTELRWKQIQGYFDDPKKREKGFEEFSAKYDIDAY